MLKKKQQSEQLFLQGYKLYKAEEINNKLTSDLSFLPYLKKASKLDNPKATFLLGYLLSVPFKDVPLDINKGNKLLSKCYNDLIELIEKESDSLACEFVAKYYQVPLANHVKDDEKVKHYLELAKQYSELSINTTRDDIENSKIENVEIDTDYNQLINAISLIEETNIDDANEQLQIIKYFANKDDIRALIFLGDCYIQGKYVKKDDTLALTYYKKAIELGSTKAKYNLGKYYIEGNYSKVDISKGLNLIYQAAKAGLKEAQFYLGQVYYEGKLVAKDLNKALIYVQASYSRGYKPAKDYLIKIEEEKGDALAISFSNSNLLDDF